jgi:FAD/FMN-containing dehydrogenase
LPWSRHGGTINDASCLNRTPVFGVIQVTETHDVRRALRFAREAGLKVSIAGVRHSMGGQAFARQAVVLDMTRFTRMSLDADRQILTVQSGATWHDIQRFLHPRFAVKAMQSTDIFTVGGSIAVNAHGMDHRAGSVGRTIRAMRVMMPDGSVRDVSRTGDPRLFNLVVGGYGLFGVILDVDLEVTPNVVYQSERRALHYRRFPHVVGSELLPDPRVGLIYAHLSTAPKSFLQEMLLYTYREIEAAGAAVPPLDEVRQVKLRRLVFNAGRLGPWGARLKWAAEKYVEPRLESCPVSRNQAMSEAEACLVSRNSPMHDSVAYLQNNLQDETDILQEYFVPRDRFEAFVDGVRDRVQSSGLTLLNASVRIVRQEGTLLTYAPQDRFGLVLYLAQSTDREGTARMAALTAALVDLTADLGGRFFLPYQLHYTPDQLLRAYPEIREFFAAKREHDPHGLLSNTFYEKYAPLVFRPS